MEDNREKNAFGFDDDGLTADAKEQDYAGEADESSDYVKEADAAAAEIAEEESWTEKPQAAAEGVDGEIPELFFGAENPEEGGEEGSFAPADFPEDFSREAEQIPEPEPIVSEALLFVQGASKLLGRKDELKHVKESFEADEEEAARSIRGLEQRIEDIVSERRNERLEAITSVYDERLQERQNEISNTKAERARAKEEGIENRILKENAPLEQENEELNERVESLYRDNKIGKLLRSPVTSALYFPKNLKDWFVGGAVGLILLFCVPLLFCLGLSGHPVVLSFIIFLYVGLIGGAYLWLLHHKMLKNRDVLEEAVSMKKQVKSNVKAMNSAAEQIRLEQDETGLGLEVFDGQIEQIESAMREIEGEKGAAVDEFEATVPEEILAEVTEENRAAMEELEEKRREIRGKIAETEEEIEGIGSELREIYEPVIGSGLIENGGIPKLEQFCRDNPSATISEAVEQFREPEETL